MKNMIAKRTQREGRKRSKEKGKGSNGGNGKYMTWKQKRRLFGKWGNKPAVMRRGGGEENKNIMTYL